METYIITYPESFFVPISQLERSVFLAEEFRDKSNRGLSIYMLPGEWYDVTPTHRDIPVFEGRKVQIDPIEETITVQLNSTANTVRFVRTVTENLSFWRRIKRKPSSITEEGNIDTTIAIGRTAYDNDGQAGVAVEKILYVDREDDYGGSDIYFPTSNPKVPALVR